MNIFQQIVTIPVCTEATSTDTFVKTHAYHSEQGHSV
jgi:hypothetical protein